MVSEASGINPTHTFSALLWYPVSGGEGEGEIAGARGEGVRLWPGHRSRDGTL